MVAILVLSACGEPAFHYVRDSAGTTYFRVPASFSRLDAHPIELYLSGLHPDSEAARLRGGRVWSAAFDQSATPALQHLLSSGEPFVYATVHRLTARERDTLSLNGLRDFVFPVTEPARTAHVTERLGAGRMPLYLRFEPLNDQVMTLDGGARGVRLRFNYQIGRDVQTFDQTAIFDEAGATVSVLIVSCRSLCFRRRDGEIDRIAQSFKLLRLPG
ncbi:hypothetical protein [Nonomuraea typhae]|uniref:Lipoprotein n=1 Tax=Nonomuraea typhae TaxID=2603600 RepID=A0ABW7YK44_9ACTN